MDIPQLTRPIGRASQENIRPERIGAHLIDSACMTKVSVQISFRIGFTAAVNGGFFSTGQVNIRFALKEIETEPSRLAEVDPFIVAFLLGGIILTFEIH